MAKKSTPKVSSKTAKRPGARTTTIGGVTIKLAQPPKQTAKARAIRKAVRDFYAAEPPV
jgi:hypothetical protein